MRTNIQKPHYGQEQMMNHIQSNQNNLKMKLLKQDIKESSQLKQYLMMARTNIQDTLDQTTQSNQDLNHHGFTLSQKKKLYQFRDTVSKSSQVLSQQIRRYQWNITNRSINKYHEHHFFRSVLLAYELKRKMLKKYTLALEDTIQKIEDDLDNVNAKDSDHLLNLRTMHRATAEQKAALQDEVLAKATRNTLLRQQVKQLMPKPQGSQQQYPSNKAQMNVEPLLDMICTKEELTKLYYKTKIHSFRDKTKGQKILRSKLTEAIKKIKEINNDQKVKKAIQQQLYRHALRIPHTEQQQQQQQQQPENNKNTAKITKTDFFIYLRGLHQQLEKTLREHQYRYKKGRAYSHPKQHPRAKKTEVNVDFLRKDKSMITNQAHNEDDKQKLYELFETKRDEVDARIIVSQKFIIDDQDPEP